MKKSTVTCVLSNCSSVCAISTVLTLFTPVWLTLVQPLKGDTVDIGLFKECIPITCYRYPTLPTYFKVTQTFLILALIALVVNSVYCFVVHLHEEFPHGIIIFFAAAAVFTLIAMTVFTTRQKTFTQMGATYSYSYYIGWVTFGLDSIMVPVSFVLIKTAFKSDAVYSAIP